MSEKLPPQNNNNQDHEKNGRANNIPNLIAREEQRLANATSDEKRAALEKRIKDLKANLAYDNDPDSYGNRNPVVHTETAASDSTSGNTLEVAEDYDEAVEKANLTPTERKMELMKSDAAQLAFTEGGDEAFIKFIEAGFKAVDDSYSKELVPIYEEQQAQSAATPEKDAFGNPVHHESAWSRNGAPQQEPFKPFGELPQNGTYISKSKELALIETPPFRVPNELQDALDTASHRYAELTARDRKSYFIGRFTKDPRSLTGKIINAIPGVRKLKEGLIDKVNDRQEEEINDAIAQYEALVAKVQETFRSYGIEQNIAPNDLKIYSAMIAGGESLKLEGRIAEQRAMQSKDTNPFVDWWVSQQGIKGNLKKAGVVVIGGAVAGAAGAALAPVWVASLAGGAAGAAAGAFIANHVTRRRANANVYARDSEGTIILDANGKKVKLEKTIAQTQSEADIQSVHNTVQDYGTKTTNGERKDNLNNKELTDIVERRTDEEAFNNRSRLRKAIMLGKLAGGLSGGFLSNAFHDASASVADQAPKAPETPTPAPPTPEAPAINGEHFVVERGSGYTKELMQFAQANGHNLNPAQSFQLHEYLMSKFGPDYINIQGNGGHDIYTQAGDVRLSSPGNAEWVKGVTAEAQKWMAGRGLW